MSRLEQILAIDGMTPAYAEALVQMGMDTYWEIYRLREDTLVSKVDEAVTQGLVDEPIDVHTAVRWQKSAIKLTFTRYVEIQVESNRYHQPLENALVRVGDVEGYTNAEGYAQLRGVPLEASSIEVSCKGFYDLSIDVDLRPESDFSFKFALASSPTGASNPVFVSEYMGDFIEVFADDHQQLRERSLQELPDGAVLLCSELETSANITRLVSLMREKDGNTIYTDRVDVSINDLPTGVEEGKLLEWSSGVLELAGYTREEFAEERAKRKFGFNTAPKWPKVVDENVPDNKTSGPVVLPELDWDDMSEQQKQEFSTAVNNHPNGIPLTLLRSILENAAQ